MLCMWNVSNVTHFISSILLPHSKNRHLWVSLSVTCLVYVCSAWKSVAVDSLAPLSLSGWTCIHSALTSFMLLLLHQVYRAGAPASLCQIPENFVARHLAAALLLASHTEYSDTLDESPPEASTKSGLLKLKWVFGEGSVNQRYHFCTVFDCCEPNNVGKGAPFPHSLSELCKFKMCCKLKSGLSLEILG